MVDAINYANKLNSCPCSKPQLAFKAEQAPVDMEQKPDTFEKENDVAGTTEEKQGMSTGKKVAIIGGSLLALVATGFGIKKYMNRVVKFGIDEIKTIINKNEVISAVLMQRPEENIKLFENVPQKINYILVLKKSDGKITKSFIKGEPTEEIASMLHKNERTGHILSGNLLTTDLFKA